MAHPPQVLQRLHLPTSITPRGILLIDEVLSVVGVDTSNQNGAEDALCPGVSLVVVAGAAASVIF